MCFIWDNFEIPSWEVFLEWRCHKKAGWDRRSWMGWQSQNPLWNPPLSFTWDGSLGWWSPHKHTSAGRICGICWDAKLSQDGLWQLKAPQTEGALLYDAAGVITLIGDKVGAEGSVAREEVFVFSWALNHRGDGPGTMPHPVMSRAPCSLQVSGYTSTCGRIQPLPCPACPDQIQGHLCFATNCKGI